MSKNKTFLIDLGNSNLEYYELSEDASLVNQKFIRTCELDQTQLNSFFCNSRCIISSVVPNLNKMFYLIPNSEVLFIDSSNVPLLKINIDTPAELGSDRIITAYAAYQKYKQPCLIIDSGTALTFCFVDSTGVYQGGAIFPGLKISSQALNDYTAQIPLIYVEEVDALMGKNTKQAVEVGLFNGFRYLINGFIAEYRMKYSDLKVIATGSAISVLEPFLDADEYEPQLIFIGLRDIFYDLS
jgi:type III pantothenate kinase